VLAGVREDLKQLLWGDGHAVLQSKKSPHMAGSGCWCCYIYFLPSLMRDTSK
jgi:hypothetical protein